MQYSTGGQITLEYSVGIFFHNAFNYEVAELPRFLAKLSDALLQLIEINST